MKDISSIEKAMNMVKNGYSYTEAARKVGISFNVLRNHCVKANIKSPIVHMKKTELEIISTIKNAKVVTNTELSQLLNYQVTNSRLRNMIMTEKIKSIIIPGSSSAAKIRWPLIEYQNRRLYYINDDDLNSWLIEKLPKKMPPGMRRIVNMKLANAGIHIYKSDNKKHKTVALSNNVYKRLNKLSKELDIPLRVLAETFVNKGLESFKKQNNKMDKNEIIL